MTAVLSATNSRKTCSYSSVTIISASIAPLNYSQPTTISNPYNAKYAHNTPPLIKKPLIASYLSPGSIIVPRQFFSLSYSLTCRSLLKKSKAFTANNTMKKPSTTASIVPLPTFVLNAFYFKPTIITRS